MRRLKESARRLQRVLRREWRSIGVSVQDRVHLATTGVRPFLGCPPRAPGESADGAAAAESRATAANASVHSARR